MRKLIEVDLFEISVVTFPMADNARVSLVKDSGALPTEREFEDWLVRDAGFSRSQAKGIISLGFKSLKAVRDAGKGDDDIAEAMRRLAAQIAGK
jgi:hypothetical protein